HGDDQESAANFMKEIEKAKKTLRVCSLSKTFDDHLLWAHYASGFSGLAIEFEIDSEEHAVVEVGYRGVFAAVNESIDAEPSSIAREVLSSKYNAWSYEQEIRILTAESFYNLKNPIS